MAVNVEFYADGAGECLVHLYLFYHRQAATAIAWDERRRRFFPRLQDGGIRAGETYERDNGATDDNA
jgi:hypothetical protein